MVSKVYSCLFCDFSSRKQHVERHCKTKHTIDNTAYIANSELFKQVRIVKDTSDNWFGFCFGCFKIVNCKFAVLSSVRHASSKHVCLKRDIQALEPPTNQAHDISHTNQSSNVEKVLEELLRKKCPDLFEHEEEDTFSVIDVVQQLIWSKNMAYKKFIENQDKFEKQIQELKREKMEIRTEKAHLENMLVAKTERITYLDDRIRTFQYQHENCSLAIKY